MVKIKKYIKENLKFFKKNILKITIIVGLIFLLSTISSFVFFTDNNVIAVKIVESFVEATKDMVELSNSKLASSIILNNIRACLMGVVLGFIPFLFLVLFVLLLNAGLIGAVLSVNAVASNIPIWKVIVFGILPHGIFELPALFISIAISIFICLFITKKLLGKEKRKFGKTFLNILLNVVIIVIPLLLIAGLIEGFVTPLIMNIYVK